MGISYNGPVTRRMMDFATASPFLKFHVTQGLILKVLAGIFLSVAGMYYLAAGRRRQSLNTMLFGCFLILFALFLF